MTEKFLIWWTNQNDCERITPLDSWPTWLYDEFRSRCGRAGRGRLWVPQLWERDASEGVSIEWDIGKNWLCRAAELATRSIHARLYHDICNGASRYLCACSCLICGQ